MASLRARTSQAAALHRQAATAVAAAASVLDATRPAPADYREQHALAEQLRAAAEVLVPGWLGAPLDAQSEDAPLGGPRLPAYVRIGTAQPLDDARFPAVVPLLGTGHLTVDADARDPRVAGLLRSVLLRLLAAAPAGSLLVRGVDGAATGMVFAPFAPLADAGLMPPPATDRTGLRAVLAEAEQWVRPARPTTARHYRRDRTLLLVIASLPELTEGADLARIGALAEHGPDSGLHLIVAGWPPPPLTAETTQPPLPRATMIALRNPYALVGDPPGTSFATPVPHLPGTGLNSPVFVDPDPPARLFERVCQELAARFDAGSCLRLADLLPDESEALWEQDASSGLAATVGQDGERAVSLGFNDLTPHWIVRGRPGAGKTAFLINVLYALCSRYSPGELAVYLLDFSPGTAFTEFVPTGRSRCWLPHVRAAGVEADREYGLAVLRELDAELTRRAEACTRAGVSRFADLAQRRELPRILCLLDEFPLLLAGGDRLAAEAVTLLESLARTGRAYGIHLILASRTPLRAEAPANGLDGLLGQFPVRVALPGGADALEPSNDSAAGLPLGTAVVNTAGGLGGPRGATRGHERTVRFPDPHLDQPILAALRQRLWELRAEAAPPPPIFVGYARPHLRDDPSYRAALAGDPPTPSPTDRPVRPTPAPAAAAGATPGDAPAAAPGVAPVDPPAAGEVGPVALIGRAIDVAGSTVTVPLGPATAGRHLTVLGPDPTGADVLDAAARSISASHAPGTARFLVSSLVVEAEKCASALAAELAERQPVELVDAADLPAAFESAEPGFLVVFGLDEVPPSALPAGLLRARLRAGPEPGPRLLSWWRRASRFVEAAGDDATTGSLVLLDVPEPEVAALLGRPVGAGQPAAEPRAGGASREWRPRPGRALLCDGSTGRATVFVPFVRPGDLT